MRALVTRPREDAQRLIAALATMGIEAQLEPMLEIRLAEGQALPSVAGYLATSANGVRALIGNGADRRTPLWAVGDATAREATAAGFVQVMSAGGDVNSLARLVIDHADPAAGSLLHAAGSALAGDLAGQLAEAGFQVERRVLYEARPVTCFSQTFLDSLAAGLIDIALFFSPRTADSFVTLAKACENQGYFGAITAFALSPAVAGRLAALPWRALRTAERPEQAALLQAIAAGGSG